MCEKSKLLHDYKSVIRHFKIDDFHIIKKKKKVADTSLLHFLLHLINMNIFNKYESFLLKNASQISSIEASLRTLTYILPGEFHLLSSICRVDH
jgi:hypothetical protein